MGYQRIIVTNDANKYEAWPGIVQLENGDIIVTYRTSDTNTHTYDPTGRIAMRKSTDNGLTWGEESTIMDVGETVDTRTGNLAIFDNDGVETLIQTSNTLNNVNHADTYVAYSTDGGVNWTAPELILAERATAGKPIQLSDDSLIIPIYKVLSNDYTVSILKSTDYGENWEEIIVNHSAPLFYNEAAVIETATPGQLFMIARWDTAGEHTATNYVQFTSTDYGETWSDPVVMDFPDYYGKRPSLTLIGENSILFSWNDKLWYNRWDISLDEGDTWHTGHYRIPIILRGHAGSYPETIQLQNGQLATVGCTNGATSDIEVFLIDSEDITSRLPIYHFGLMGDQSVVYKDVV